MICDACEENWTSGEGRVAKAPRSVTGRMCKWNNKAVEELEGRLKKAHTELEQCMLAMVLKGEICRGV